MRLLDLIVILFYLLLIGIVGIGRSGKQRNSTDYFVGNRNLPWWVVCFSIVATETSTLTVISVPGVAYLDAFVFVGLAIGYLLGRTVVAFVLLPLYMHGDLTSAYQYLGRRFGRSVQRLASATFLLTRLLAEGVRLFASAIPVELLLAGLGIHVSYFEIVFIIMAVTLTYTLVGGIRAVIWTDAIQMGLYVACGALCVFVLLSDVGLDGVEAAYTAGKFRLFDYGAPVLTNPYAFVTAVLGGAAFTTASHGADQLIVQRVLACRNLADGRRAMIGSAFAVLVQSALFSLVGVLLWVRFNGQTPQQLGFASSDQLFPYFILNGLPEGLSGLLVAGILAATMGSLSSALNSLTNSTVTDLVQTFDKLPKTETALLRISRIFTVLWAVSFLGFALLFTGTTSPIVVLGLSIAGYTYGALLGSFLLGVLIPRANHRDAFFAFLATLLTMSYVELGFRINELPIAFPWFVPIGVVVSLVAGGTLSRMHPKALRQ